MDIVKFFVELGVDVNHVGVGGLTPLSVAGEAGDVEIASYLLEQGATYVPKAKSPVLSAIQFGQTEVLELFFENGFVLEKNTISPNVIEYFVQQSRKGESDYLENLLSNTVEDTQGVKVCDYTLNVFERIQRRITKVIIFFLIFVLFFGTLAGMAFYTYLDFAIGTEKNNGLCFIY